MQKTILLLIAYLVCTYAVYGNKGACKTKKYKPVHVDWKRYLGKWYNVAVSNSFQYSDSSDQCTTATYSLKSDGSIKVDNKKIKKDCKLEQAIGSAKIVSSGKLSVKFSEFQPFGANYEVVYITKDYTGAIVVGCNGYGNSGVSDVWILVRNYKTDLKQIENAVKIAAYMGFDVSDVKRQGIQSCDRL